jgi:hypothetical protein
MLYLILSNRINGKTLLAILVAIYASYLLLFAIPTFRGYFLYGRGAADVLSHLGDVRTILVTSHVAENNFYPIVHVLVFVFSSLGTPLNFTPTLVAIVLLTLYSVGTFVLVRRIAESTRIAVLVCACSVPLLFLTHYLTLQPFLQSFLLIPFTLYLLEEAHFSQESRRYVALLTIFLFAVVFAHPETTVLLAVIFLASVIAQHIYVSRYDVSMPRYNLLILPILAIAFFAWYFSFQGLREYGTRIIGSVFLGVKGQTPPPRGISITDSALELADVFTLVVRFVELFGSTAIYFCFATIMAGIVLWRMTRNRYITFFECYATVNFGVAITVTAVLLFGVPLFGNAFMRAARFPLLFAAPLAALLVFELTERQRIEFTPKHRKVLVFGCIVLLLTVVPLTINGLFIDNYHLTDTEYQGTEFFLKQYDDEHATKSVRMTSKIEAYIYGTHMEQRGELPFRRFHTQGTEIPKHIGYNNHSTAGQTFDNGTYLITKEHDLEFYKTRPKEEWDKAMIYSEEDLDRLSDDRCVYKIYSNGGFEVWVVC